MSVVMRMHWPGIGIAEYDAVREEVGWEDQAPNGGHLHVALIASEGLDVWDVWESPEAFGAFTNERLMPGVARLSLEGEPTVKIEPCHYFQRELIVGGRLLAEVGTVPSADTYDVFAAKVDWDNQPPRGGICHIAARAEGGTIETLSVWRSAQACVRFAVDRMKPVADELGVPLEIDGNPPSFAYVHALYAPAGGPNRLH